MIEITVLFADNHITEWVLRITYFEMMLNKGWNHSQIPKYPVERAGVLVSRNVHIFRNALSEILVTLFDHTV